LEIFILAADRSADHHGAFLLRALQARQKDGSRELSAFHAWGVGGDRLAADGLEVIIPASGLAVNGVFPVVKALGRLVRAFIQLFRRLRAAPPAFMILIDFGGFNLLLLRACWFFGILKKNQTKVIYFIPPKVWVWRSSRIRWLKKCDLVLCILPFEEAFLKAHGVNAHYVGNPLVDQIPSFLQNVVLNMPSKRDSLWSQKQSLRKILARDQQGHLKLNDPGREFWVLLMPGTRESEFAGHFDLFLEAWEGLFGDAVFADSRAVIILPGSLHARALSKIQSFCDKSLMDPSQIMVLSDVAETKYLAMACCNLALVKSGTSTLEVGLMGVPQIVVYRCSAFLQFAARKIMGYTGPAGLVNLALRGWNRLEKREPLFPEYLGPHVNAYDLTKGLRELWDVWKHPAEFDARRHLQGLQKAFLQQPSSSQQACELIWDLYDQRECD
jgi:lipid-A-disaccharide synthase